MLANLVLANKTFCMNNNYITRPTRALFAMDSQDEKHTRELKGI